MGNSVIDYILGDEDTRDGVKRMEIGERVDSDHLPLTVWLKGERAGGTKRGEGVRSRLVGCWTEEGVEKFRRKFGKKGGTEKGVEEDWKELKGKVKEVIEGMGKKRRGEKKGWWDE
ncbi:uncharacterized protein LOC143358075 [Halictus rubicundus]|uniref:uncharacterized protein LOC143358075 n=1 Tax=Halictus rubicundus TaxID=77578 RepID=UPI0040363334